MVLDKHIGQSFGDFLREEVWSGQNPEFQEEQPQNFRPGAKRIFHCKDRLFLCLALPYGPGGKERSQTQHESTGLQQAFGQPANGEKMPLFVHWFSQEAAMGPEKWYQNTALSCFFP